MCFCKAPLDPVEESWGNASSMSLFLLPGEGSINSWEMRSRGILSKGREPALVRPPEPGGKQGEETVEMPRTPPTLRLPAPPLRLRQVSRGVGGGEIPKRMRSWSSDMGQKGSPEYLLTPNSIRSAIRSAIPQCRPEGSGVTASSGSLLTLTSSICVLAASQRSHPACPWPPCTPTYCESRNQHPGLEGAQKQARRLSLCGFCCCFVR